MSSQDVRNLIEEIAELSHAELQPIEFYHEVLGRVGPRLRAAATAVWTCSDENVDLLCQTGLDGNSILDDKATRDRHWSLLAEVRKGGQPRLVYPGPNGAEAGTANPTDYFLGICPVKVDHRVVSLIESFQNTNAHPAQSEAALKLLTVVAGLATNYHRNLQLRWWRQLDAFSRAIHKSLHPKETAYTIANDGRRVVDCDRLSVMVRKGRKCRALAISGQETVNRRANSVRRLEKLVARVLAIGEPLLYPDRSVELPPQLEEAVHAYVDESQSRSLYVLPLEQEPSTAPEEEERERAPKIVGAVVAEQFSGGTFDAQRVEAVGQHASRALANALQHHRVFLLPLWSAIGKMGWLVQARTLPKTLAVVVLLVSVVLGAIFVPAEFKLTAEGTLQPEARRHVFARVDGVVEQLLVKHGDQVGQGDVLATMRNSEIGLELQRVEGEIETTTKKLMALNASRLAARSLKAPRNPGYLNQLTAEEEELRQWMVSLRRQRKLLLEQQENLRVRSPVAGQIVTWDVDQLLASRPVTRGQILMTVAELDGPWVLELLLPDRRVGHMQDAQGQLRKDLPVSYILATDPDRTLYGTIQKVSKSTKLDEKEGLGVRVTVAIREEDIEHLRPGAKVIGRIHCGRRPIGYVWLHEVFEFVQSRILFRFF